ncbi:hypothetical protein Ancab_033215 [Ancistrocladus abbreviatus]
MSSSQFEYLFDLLCFTDICSMFIYEKLHEAIMREESNEFEGGIILEEYRKGFKLGDTLLFTSMVKVSAGPGPAKPETQEPSATTENASKSSEDVGSEADSKDQTAS